MENYYSSPRTEQMCVGTGLGVGFEQSRELKTLNYKEEMASDEIEQRMHGIDKVDERMKNCKGWTEVPKKDVPKNAKPLTSTWAFKKNQMANAEGG